MNIVLIGFMGSGKSSVAPLVAKQLGLSCVEMDTLALQASTRSSIAEIFTKDGEHAFRKLEETIAASLARQNHQIIAAGGGVVMHEKTMKHLHKSGNVVFLKTSWSSIAERLRGVTNRPLWKDPKKAFTLFVHRVPLYRKHADCTILTDGKSAIEVANEIVKHMGGAL